MATAPVMGATAATAAADRPASESRVDRDSHFNGLFETKQNLRIEGVAEGEIQCEGTVTVAEGARVKAKVTANTVTIAGVLEGDVVCQNVFQIMPTGQVDATVSARRLIVQEGGFYNGEFHMITDSAAAEMAKGGTGSRRGSTVTATPEPAGASDALGNDDWWAKLSGSTTPAAEEPEEKPNKKPGK